ncbi:spore germination protein [Paenibacillus sp. JTLBN-2024]
MEGKVAILVDGSPFVLLAPVTIFKLFQSSEDYYQKFDIATFLRLLRVISLWSPCCFLALYCDYDFSSADPADHFACQPGCAARRGSFSCVRRSAGHGNHV